MTDARHLDSHNPANGLLIGSVPIATSDEVNAAVASVRAAQPAWAALPLAERALALRRVQHLILERQDSICATLSAEVGKPTAEALFHEVLTLVTTIHYYRRHAARILAPTPIPLEVARHRASYLHYQPRGVSAVIAPWNFPFTIAGAGVTVALLAGNGVVLKPSEHTPLSGELLKELFVAGGVPAAVFQVVHGHGDVGAALIDAQPDHVEFTGSLATGRKVAAHCGELLIPSAMELGGKAPALVLPDADLERTANALTWGAFANCGQICASVERVLVHRSVHDRLVEMLVERAQSLTQGDPGSDPGVNVGPLNNARQRDIVRAHVAQAVDKGAQIRCGGSAPDGPGFFFPPTVLTGVTTEMDVANREIFGPLMPIMALDSVDAMLDEANRLKFGLLAYVFTQDRRRGRDLAEQIEAGSVLVNDVLSSYGMPEVPWHGLKDSGLGQVHGDAALRDQCQLRHVNHGVLPELAREPWFYPYRSRDQRLIRRAMGLLFGKRPWQR